MKTQRLFLSAAVIAAIAVSACHSKKTVSENPATSPVETIPSTVSSECSVEYTYDLHIKSIMDQNCTKCHGGNGFTAGGIDLTSYENVKAEAGNKRFMGALRHEMDFVAMPKKSPKLSDSTLLILNCWISNGRQK